MNTKIEKEAIKRTKRDANKADIQTTAEGKAFLSARFSYWMKKLKR